MCSYICHQECEIKVGQNENPLFIHEPHSADDCVLCRAATRASGAGRLPCQALSSRTRSIDVGSVKSRSARAPAWPLRRAKITIKGAWVGRRRVCDLSALQRAPASGDVRRDARRGWHHTISSEKHHPDLLRFAQKGKCHLAKNQVSLERTEKGHRHQPENTWCLKSVPQYEENCFWKISDTNKSCLFLVSLWCASKVDFSPEVEKQAPQMSDAMNF